MAECDRTSRVSSGRTRWRLRVRPPDRRVPADRARPAAGATYDRLAAAWASGEDAPAASSPDPRSADRASTARQRERYGTDSAPMARVRIRARPWRARVGQRLHDLRSRHRERGPGANRGGISGFSAAWALFSAVLPGVAGGVFHGGRGRGGGPRRGPAEGALPNGAGLKFSSDPPRSARTRRRRGHLAVAGRPVLHVRLAADVCDGTIGFVPLGGDVRGQFRRI